MAIQKVFNMIIDQYEVPGKVITAWAFILQLFTLIGLSVNEWLTIVMSVLGIIYMALKIQNEWLIRKQKKIELKKEKSSLNES